MHDWAQNDMYLSIFTWELGEQLWLSYDGKLSYSKIENQYSHRLQSSSIIYYNIVTTRVLRFTLKKYETSIITVHAYPIYTVPGTYVNSKTLMYWMVWMNIVSGIVKTFRLQIKYKPIGGQCQTDRIWHY